MRLRSSHFVFLLLLVCTVQIREEYAQRWMAEVVSGSADKALKGLEPRADAAGRTSPAGSVVALPPAPVRLDAASRSAHRTAWTMRRPALSATAVASHTSLLRA